MNPLEISGLPPALQQVSFLLSQAYAIAYGADPLSGDRSTTTVSSPPAAMSSEIQVVSAPARRKHCKRVEVVASKMLVFTASLQYGKPVGPCPFSSSWTSSLKTIARVDCARFV